MRSIRSYGDVHCPNFFERRLLSRQYPDLGVEFFDMILVFLLHFRDAFPIIYEELREVLNGISFSPVEDIRVNTLFRCQLGNGLFFLQHFQY
ncbi:hypothetical protein [Marinicrinis sediminis]|uniref:Uncharacterized protein n=1 Tax=Marinicrinis sediminis TaxID=1652465 RepID=A0ABW5RCA7_9BACL